MKNILRAGFSGNFRLSFVVAVVFGLTMVSCIPDPDKLGVDIFPPSDTILIYTDTITNMKTTLVRTRPMATSITAGSSSSRYFVLGSRRDTLTGLTKADIVTEFTPSYVNYFYDTTLVDSLALYLYISDSYGDTLQPMHLMVYEFTDSLSIDSVYYSDYDITGKYDPTPLVDEVIYPRTDSTFVFEIENETLRQRILAATNPSDSNFYYTARLQELFPGLYITTETVSENGAFVRIPLANSYCGLRFKYVNGHLSEEAIDTIGYSTYNISFSQYSAQKVNMFHHDYTGTAVNALLDNEDATPPIAYIQGMAGISMKISLPDIFDQMGLDPEDKVVFNAARLLFYVVPDSISGVNQDSYPDNLLMDTQYADGDYYPLYDYIIVDDEYYFGKLTRSNEQSAFLDPLYYYNFHIGRHLQAVRAGEIENTMLYVYPEDDVINPEMIKVWTNTSGEQGGLRLELIYTKF